MRPYIVNLTNELIRKNRFLDISKRTGMENRQQQQEFGKIVWITLHNRDIAKMNPGTLGKILCELENGDVMTSQEELARNLYFAGNCGQMLQGLVAYCLTCVIRDRILGGIAEMGIPPYIPTGTNP